MTRETERNVLLGILAGAVGLGIGALVLLAASAIAGGATPPATLAIALSDSYESVAEAMRSVCGDGVIRGTAEYEAETTLHGAAEAATSGAFPRWSGSGDLCYKVRVGAIAPSNFAGSQDRGTVTVRYIVERGPRGTGQLTIDAVFVENTHHGRHASRGFVETAEFGAIGKLLKSAGAPAAKPATAPGARSGGPEIRRGRQY
jgi:hypothetical protein